MKVKHVLVPRLPGSPLSVTVHLLPAPPAPAPSGGGRDEPGGLVAEIVMARPPVNALDVAGWRAVAEAITHAGADPAVRAVVLRAEGRGFNAGVDIKELGSGGDHAALVAVNQACAAAFAAVYDCPVPVVVAVHGYCLGGGVGLAGNADVLVLADDASLGLPEVERGALGAATHLARLVPPARLRGLLYTGARVTAAELDRWGAAWRVVPRDELRSAAIEVAMTIASRDPVVMRAAKAAATHIDPVDPKASYRMEQGYTFELHLEGAGDRARGRFLGGKGGA